MLIKTEIKSTTDVIDALHRAIACLDVLYLVLEGDISRARAREGISDALDAVSEQIAYVANYIEAMSQRP